MSFVITNKKTGGAIDIQGASKASVANIDAFHPKTSDAENQQWHFVPIVSGPDTGYFLIKSELAGAFVKLSTENYSSLIAEIPDGDPLSTDSHLYYLWRFVQDPYGSGCCLIQSRVNSTFVAISSLENGASLDASAPLVLLGDGYDWFLWKTGGSGFPGIVHPPSELTFSAGTGTGTEGSGAAESAYSAKVVLKQDGSCSFSGTYTNRGDTFGGAPPQDFAVVIVVHDLNGTGYSFAACGYVFSAPQEYSTAAWDASAHYDWGKMGWLLVALRYEFTGTIETHATGYPKTLADSATIQNIANAGGSSAGATGEVITGQLAFESTPTCGPFAIIVVSYTPPTAGGPTKVGSGITPGVGGGWYYGGANGSSEVLGQR